MAWINVCVCLCVYPQTGRPIWRMTSCSEICGSDYAEPAQASVNCQQYGVRSYLHQVLHATNRKRRASSYKYWHPLILTVLYYLTSIILISIGFSSLGLKAHPCQSLSVSRSFSFMRSAQHQSGNVMKIFRFRDRLAGGALYSGRWGEPSATSYLLKFG